VGALVDLVVTILAGCLVAMIGFLLKGRFDTQTGTLSRIEADTRELTGRLVDVERDVTRLTEAQRAVVVNQAAHSRVAERILDESDELADKISQLDHLTDRLYERMRVHDTYLAALRGDTPIGG